MKQTRTSTWQRLKRVFIPINQPESFPRLYFIPETVTVSAPRLSANDHSYGTPAAVHPIREPLVRAMYRRTTAKLAQKIDQALARVWEAAKRIGRAVVRWIATRIVLPLAVISSFWIATVSPAELPM